MCCAGRLCTLAGVSVWRALNDVGLIVFDCNGWLVAATVKACKSITCNYCIEHVALILHVRVICRMCGVWLCFVCNVCRCCVCPLCIGMFLVICLFQFGCGMLTCFVHMFNLYILSYAVFLCLLEIKCV